jgi:Tfp pilus assembly protein PilO
MAGMSGRERRLVGVAVVVATAIAGWTFVVEPLVDRNRTMAELVPARHQVLDKRRALLARAPALRKELEEATVQIEQLKGHLLTAATPAVAASELVRIVKDASRKGGLEVRSERILTPVAHGELLEIPLEITVAGGIRELVTMLHAIEEASKLLTLQDIKIRVLNVSQPKELLTTITVSGFILPATGDAKQS